MFRDPASSTFRNILVASVIGVGVFLIPNGAQSATSDSATIQWATNQESDVAGYRVYRGTTSGVYGGPQNAGTTTTYQYDNLESNKTHYFSITAYDGSGNESPPSLEVSKAIPGLGTSGGSTSTSPPSNGAAWSAAAQSPVGSWKDSGFDNRTFRILLKGSAVTASGSTIQVRFRGRSSGNYSLANVSLVRRTGSTLDGDNSTSRAITFGGASSVSVPPGGITSDPIAFNLVAGQDVFLTFWVPAGKGGVYRTGSTGTTAWFITGTNKSAVIDWGGLSISGTRSYVYDAELIP